MHPLHKVWLIPDGRYELETAQIYHVFCTRMRYIRAYPGFVILQGGHCNADVHGQPAKLVEWIHGPNMSSAKLG